MTTKDKLQAYLATRVTYEIECTPEDLQIEGNALASGDDATDQAHYAYVRRELASGNEWAWCSVKMTCRLDGSPYTGVDYLGACQYTSQRDFERDAYCTDMRSAALGDLVEVILRAALPPPRAPDPIALAIVTKARRTRTK